MRAKSIGNVRISALTNTGIEEVKAEEVLHVPDSTVNLLSVSKIVEKGLSVHFTPSGNKIEDSDGHCLGIMTNEGIFKLMTREERSYLAAKRPTAELWHKRLGHLNYESIVKLSKEPSSGIHLEKIENIPCVPCVKGKHHRQPFPKKGSRATEMLEIVHSDLCGPMETASLAGSKYFLTLIDDFTRKTFIYFLKKKARLRTFSRISKLPLSDKQVKKYESFEQITEGSIYITNFKQLLNNTE